MPALITAVSDENVDVRRRAITALGRIEPAASSAIPRLVQALAEDDADARAAALLALRRFGPAAKAGAALGSLA
ncbi:MAG: HEAT repeat domain-containing protein [Planctomycetes bacterium]|nr:HEAT repeat domain-containing protein [Planctomycetota bacterium]